MCGSQAPYDGMQNFLRGVVTSFTKLTSAFALPSSIFTDRTSFTPPPISSSPSASALSVLARRVKSITMYQPGYGSDTHIEPRFGFTWSPSPGKPFLFRLAAGSGQTSIRGGFGMFHGLCLSIHIQPDRRQQALQFSQWRSVGLEQSRYVRGRSHGRLRLYSRAANRPDGPGECRC